MKVSHGQNLLIIVVVLLVMSIELRRGILACSRGGVRLMPGTSLIIQRMSSPRERFVGLTLTSFAKLGSCDAQAALQLWDSSLGSLVIH